MGEGVVRPYRQRLLPVTHSVGLHVCLGNHIDAVLVTKVVQEIVVRIVAGTDGVHVELLHYADVLDHTLAGNHITSVRIKFVTVHTLEQHRLAVYQNLGIDYLHLSETYFHRYHLSSANCPECVQVRGFSSPFVNVPDVQRSLEQGTVTSDRLGRHHSLTGIKQLHGYGLMALAGYFNIQGSVLIGGIQVWCDLYVIYPVLVPCEKVTVTGESAKAEKVLILQISTVTPAEYLEGKEVFLSRFYILGNVKFRFQLAVLAVSHISAVHPDIYIGCHGTYMQEHVLAVPAGRDFKFLTVCPHVVVFCRQ